MHFKFFLLKLEREANLVAKDFNHKPTSIRFNDRTYLEETAWFCGGPIQSVAVYCHQGWSGRNKQSVGSSCLCFCWLGNTQSHEKVVFPSLFFLHVCHTKLSKPTWPSVKSNCPPHPQLHPPLNGQEKI